VYGLFIEICEWIEKLSGEKFGLIVIGIEAQKIDSLSFRANGTDIY